jgi:glycyl-tRNA synthetase beta chain
MSSNIPFLLEIGTEEIPARFFDIILPLLEKHTIDTFERNRIEFSDISCMATPRRIALSATIINPVQQSVVTEITGPPVKAAFDSNSNPTKAAEGFARSQGVQVKELKTKSTDKGDYIAVIKEIKGEKVAKVLPDIVPEVIKSLHFPKSMRWGYHTIRFARPIRWLLCLLGSSVVRFEIDGIKSGSFTWGHRLLANRKVKIESPGKYESTLKRSSVIVDQHKRKELIRKGIDTLAKKTGTKQIKDEELLNTVNYLVEYPYAVLCSFPEEYLLLPDELLITVMKDHQKYFALTNKKGSLVNSFAVVSNNNSKIASTVRAGAEKVIKARFEDARFYYSEDIKTTLEQRRDELKRVTYHEKIGTIFEKVERIRTVSSEICHIIQPDIKDNVSLVSGVSKSDLTTGVVREFPELQGVIGYYYALHEGKAKEIAVAIKEHYKPTHAGDTVPSTEEGKMVSIADKIDSVCAFFSVGITPTGSEDPYALRRQAQGIVQIMMSSRYPVSLRELIRLSLSALNAEKETTIDAVSAFFVQRIEFALTTAGYKEDTVKSILHESLDVPLHVLTDKLKALSQFKKSPLYNDFLLAIKRTRNILPDLLDSPLDEELLSQNAEIDLKKHIDTASGKIDTLIESNEFGKALNEILTITESINRFFDDVLVMDKDENVKKNRLALLKYVWDTAIKICDFSRLSEK